MRKNVVGTIEGGGRWHEREGKRFTTTRLPIQSTARLAGEGGGSVVEVSSKVFVEVRLGLWIRLDGTG